LPPPNTITTAAVVFNSTSTNIQRHSQFNDIPIAGGLTVVSQNALAALLAAATNEINVKATQLGSLPGNPRSSVEPLAVGYVRRYDAADIYYSLDTGAHEVHGDIRAKYDALQGPNGLLGLPTTDETGTPDGFGRFNHFVGGSIYWTPNTGPMMVRGAIRDLWASQGWERGALGYPVIDQHRFRTFSPSTDPVTLWNLFENGAIVFTVGDTAAALAAEVSPDQLRSLVRRQFDQAFHKSPDNVGLEPNIETVSVSGWGYGIWASQPRTITFRLHGFRDNGLAWDTTFEITAELRFGLTWEPSFVEPSPKTLIVELGQLSVTAHGPASQSIADGVAGGVRAAFKEPIRIVDIPVGDLNAPDFVDLLVTREGGLELLMNPLPDTVGRLRKLIAQRQIDSLISG